LTKRPDATDVRVQTRCGARCIALMEGLNNPDIDARPYSAEKSGLEHRAKDHFFA